MSALFELRGVSKSYRRGKEQVPVLSNLDLQIDAGDFMAIMGPSGSGKSTLLNLLSGIDRPTAGELLFNGQDLSAKSESALAKWRSRNIGFVFQFYHLISVLNARQNVELPLLLTDLSTSERTRRVDRALEIVGMSDRLRHKPREMSGGQQQRVAIARAIVSDPAVIICDEPTGDLDRQTADSIMTIIRDLNVELGKTIILVTYDPAAAAYAGSIFQLDKGIVRENSDSHV